jgi:hypothetical protein
VRAEGGLHLRGAVVGLFIREGVPRWRPRWESR